MIDYTKEFSKLTATHRKKQLKIISKYTPKFRKLEAKRATVSPNKVIKLENKIAKLTSKYQDEHAANDTMILKDKVNREGYVPTKKELDYYHFGKGAKARMATSMAAGAIGGAVGFVSFIPGGTTLGALAGMSAAKPIENKLGKVAENISKKYYRKTAKLK